MQDSIPGTLCMHKSRSNRLEELFFIRIHDTTLYYDSYSISFFQSSCLASLFFHISSIEWAFLMWHFIVMFSTWPPLIKWLSNCHNRFVKRLLLVPRLAASRHQPSSRPACPPAGLPRQPTETSLRPLCFYRYGFLIWDRPLTSKKNTKKDVKNLISNGDSMQFWIEWPALQSRPVYC